MIGAGFFDNPTVPGIFLGSFIIGLSGAVAPGPVLARTVAQTPRHGFLTGPIIIVGHSILEFVLVVAIFFGFGRVLTTPTAFVAIALAGGLVLMWMSFSMFREIPGLRFELAGVEGAAKMPKTGLIWDGVIASAANPYWSIWWATIGLSFIALAQPLGIWGVTAFFAGHISSDYAWYGLVSALVAAGRNRLPDGFYKTLVGVCAAALGLFGLLFIIHAVQNLVS